MLPDYAIIDPVMVMSLPQSITADTGLDALTQSIESYQSTWRNDFSDALCLHAIRLIFEYLPRVHADGSIVRRASTCTMRRPSAASVLEIRRRRWRIAWGHALGALFHVPHGRTVALFLPYTIEFYVIARQSLCGHRQSAGTPG